MDVEATVSERVNLLGEQLHPLARVAEDDRLRDLQLVEQRGEAVQLLLLLEVGVVLRQALQSQFLARANEHGLFEVALLELLDLLRVRRAEECKLGLGHNRDNLLDDLGKVLREQLVDLIEDKKPAMIKICHVFGCQVEDSAWGRNHHVHCLVQSVEIFAHFGTASRHHALELLVL